MKKVYCKECRNKAGWFDYRVCKFFDSGPTSDRTGRKLEYFEYEKETNCPHYKPNLRAKLREFIKL